ncbi:MAG: hypothetical protein J0M08_05290 [Bacteroidetes bacterium]|nr:hypothetical protein [Bacteroidota bacterium]
MQRIIFFLVSLLILASVSCRKDRIIEDSSAMLSFSEESILFDTVFTTLGSTTKRFKVYNNHNQSIRVSNIRLGSGITSSFRMNVDGISAVNIGEVIIPKKDSIYVFVEVTVNPTNQNNPLVIRDSITFETNGNTQHVLLEAWGQDAYYHKPTVFPANGFPPYSVFDCNDVWTNDKPHVIYGYAVVDSSCTLTIMPGTRVHLYKNAVLWVYKDGTLNVAGAKGNEVKFSGTRLEPSYDNVPGQWGRIWFSALSKNNSIDWAIIKNGAIGLHVDTFPNTLAPTLHIKNTIVKNMSSFCILGQGAKIRAYNSVFADAGEYVAALTIGGAYGFYHCTFASYNTSRTNPLLLVKNWYEDVFKVKHVRGIDSAYFGNCIVYGSTANEIKLDSLPGKFYYKFDHCLLKTDINTSSAYHFKNNVLNQEPYFGDVGNVSMGINSNSAARNIGDLQIGTNYPVDFNTNSRIADGMPDAGAFEYQ